MAKPAADKRLSCIVLAAGMGTRMKSSFAKVLHPIYGKPMLDYVLDTCTKLKPVKTAVVVNSIFDQSLCELNDNAVFALQKEQKGTADAVEAGARELKQFKGTVLVLNGDTPLITAGTLKKFIRLHKKNKNAISVLSFMAYDPTGYGRIIRDPSGMASAIVEEKDATEDEKLIAEVNSGVYAIEHSALALLKNIKINKKKKEFYLTDIVSLAIQNNLGTGVYCENAEEEFLGINSRLDLAMAYEALRVIKIDELLSKGVTLIDPASVYISPDVSVASDTTIYPNVFIHGGSKIGKGCTIYPNVRIEGSTLAPGAIIKDASLIEESIIGKNAEIGPMAHVRPGSRIGNGAKVGNFVEIKKSDIGQASKVGHMAYIGDTEVGRNVNIGAGTITCNYDGTKKNKTIIGDNVFIGSDSQLVAPVTIDKGSYIGAGSTITKDVPKESLSISRSKQKTFEGWARKNTKKNSSRKKK
jgi:bifunctional UDP-N-acetylglucosamine pyrophosphorylase/glucosamine-1-phosphate N-acetyltransferase